MLARTVKGKGFAEVEDKNGWPLPADMARRAVAALPRYQVAGEVATRKAYGDTLVAVGVRPHRSRTEGMEAHDGY
ncbi:MAG: hypothetical protein ACRDNT_27210 [Streptosporangiaceae bacterium]